MPSSRAILADITDKHLDPYKRHTKYDKSGRLRAPSVVEFEPVRQKEPKEETLVEEQVTPEVPVVESVTEQSAMTMLDDALQSVLAEDVEPVQKKESKRQANKAKKISTLA